jgi:hypothetical protein
MTVDTINITEFDVEALIDSQLDWEREKQVWRELAHNRALCAYYQEMLAQKKRLLAWWNQAFHDAG